MGNATGLVDQPIGTSTLMDENLSKRRFLVTATTVAGGAAIAGAAVPFVASMLPSERAKAGGAPVDADFSKLAPDEQVTVEWRGQPVWILHRTEVMLKALEGLEHRANLVDPDSKLATQQPAYVRNAFRSIKPEYLVVVPLCTHLGCIPSFRPDVAPADLGPKWPGGYYCPCHGSRFDFSGRVYRNVPAPTNLAVPPHHYLSSTTIRIGEDPGGRT